MIMFSDDDKIEAACKFIKVLHATAGCTAREIKKLFHPRIIDAVLKEAKQGEQKP